MPGPTRRPAITRANSLRRRSTWRWVLVCGFLVMFMQVGFAMFETGFTRAKNAVNTMAMNLVIYPVGLFGFWIMGYALMMGGVSNWPSLKTVGMAHRELSIAIGGHQYGLIGCAKFALVSVSHDPGSLAMFLFAVVFMDTAATIPTGAMAERWKFSAFFVYGLFMSMFLYPLFGNWVWGGGWLSQLGVNLGLGHGDVDFAGSSVVHMTGGFAALAGAITLGPRIGKFRRDGAIGLLPGHNIPMGVVGTLILAFGWFGFNTGSTLAATDSRIGIIAVNTMLASAGGALSGMLYLWHRYHKPDVAMACNGMLGGLVAITASCAFVTPEAAVMIGVIAGLIVVGSVLRNRAAFSHRRPGRRDFSPWHLRYLGSARSGPVRRRFLWRRLERRRGSGSRITLRRRGPIRVATDRRRREHRGGIRTGVGLLPGGRTHHRKSRARRSRMERSRRAWRWAAKRIRVESRLREVPVAKGRW